MLSGCGVYDGAEVQESAYALAHLSRAGCVVSCFAPDKPQFHVIDHTKGEVADEARNCLAESARICRGAITPLSHLCASNFDALVVPGGFGAAKNLCNHATVAQGDASKMEVDENLERALKEFSVAGKPVGLACISPVIAAHVLKCTVTVGSSAESAKWPYAGTAGAIENYGGQHVDTDIDGFHVDSAAKVATSACYMYDGAPHEIYDSMGHVVRATLDMI